MTGSVTCRVVWLMVLLVAVVVEVVEVTEEVVEDVVELGVHTKEAVAETLTGSALLLR